jgi:excisionase family DNA binding protein
MTTITRHTPYADLPEWMTIEEVMAYLAIGRTRAYESAKSGGWTLLKAGRLIRVHKSAFAAGGEE